MTYQGRRREDQLHGNLPDDVEPGDYWRVLRRDGSGPLQSTGSPSNLTGGVWMFRAPVRGGIGTLRYHTVREHDDGTCSIRPGDGSSNSVLITGGGGEFHGYLEHGVWSDA